MEKERWKGREGGSAMDMMFLGPACDRDEVVTYINIPTTC